MLLALGALLWLVAACLIEDAPPPGAVVPAVLLTLLFGVRLVRRSWSAVTNAFGAQSAYTFTLSALVLVASWRGPG